MDIPTKLRLIQEGYTIQDITSGAINPFGAITENVVSDELDLFIESINADFDFSMSLLNESSNEDVNPIIKFINWLKEKIMQFINFLRRLFKRNVSESNNLIKEIEAQVKQIKTLDDQINKVQKNSRGLFGLGKSYKYMEDLGRLIDQKRARNWQNVNNPRIADSINILFHPNPDRFGKLSDNVKTLLDFVEDIERGIPGDTINGREYISDNELAEFILFFKRHEFANTPLDPKRMPTGESILLVLKNNLDTSLAKEISNIDPSDIYANPGSFIKNAKGIIDQIDRQQQETVKYVEKMRTKLEKMENSLRRFKILKFFEKKAIMLRIRAIKTCIDIASVITNHLVSIQKQTYNGMIMIQKLYDTEIRLLGLKKEMVNKLSNSGDKNLEQVYQTYLDYINDFNIDEEAV